MQSFAAQGPPSRAPFFTVVIPVHDAGPAFHRCLAALEASSYRDWNLVIVDDGSTDGSACVARQHGARLLETGGRRGPAAARNLGAAHANGTYLLFLDADCAVHLDTLEILAAALAGDPVLDAVFGSYDAEPAARRLTGQYRNLLHHFVHQAGGGEIDTFWAGCGAMRRQLFLELGGFDADRYPRPSIEDIELGYRLSAAGGRIRLLPQAQVTHHKDWTLWQVLRTDVRDRAAPWTELSLRRRRLGRELNLGLRDRTGVGLALIGLGGLLTAPLAPAAGLAAAAAGAALLGLHHELYGFFRRRKGLRFAAAAVPLHWLYLLSCAAGAAAGTLRHCRHRLRREALA